MRANEASRHVLDAAMNVHSALGAGCLESAYAACLSYELASRNIRFLREVKLPVTYRGLTIDVAYRIDFLVEDCLIVEAKAVKNLQPIHLAQVLSYLRLSRRPLGLLINFNVAHLREGIRRVINAPESEL